MFVAGKYLRAKKSQRFISFTSGLSVLGIAIGVMALIVVISVMNGFEDDIKSKILGTQSHVIVSGFNDGVENPAALIGKFKKDPDVLGATPFILAQGLISSNGNVRGIVIRGIDFATAPNVVRIKDIISQGKYEDLGETGLFIGSELASTMAVTAGDEVNIISPDGPITPIGVIPTSRKFLVKGTFATGMYEYDSNMVYISLGAAQKLFRKDMPSGVEIKIKDIYNADEVASRLVKSVGPGYWAKTWMDMNRSLFSALKLEKNVMFIILLFIILVAVFSIVSTLIMLVMEKRKDIAVLKSMGATRKQILGIFMSMGMVIGLSGTLVGLSLGLLICFNLNEIMSFVELVFKIQVMPKDVYFITGLPVKVKPIEIAFITIAALLMSLVATIYPARQAAKQDPVEVLRYEV